MRGAGWQAKMIDLANDETRTKVKQDKSEAKNMRGN